jgi:hypothetical protein
MGIGLGVCVAFRAGARALALAYAHPVAVQYARGVLGDGPREGQGGRERTGSVKSVLHFLRSTFLEHVFRCGAIRLDLTLIPWPPQEKKVKEWPCRVPVSADFMR